ncbi:MAG: hypothetical protein ABIN97_15235 [Ginsengibacter sp.]
MNNITPEDLVQYLYNETSSEKTMAIKAALESDWSIREAFDQMVAAQKQLEEVKLSPREEAIKEILDHADKTISHQHSHS